MPSFTLETTDESVTTMSVDGAQIVDSDKGQVPASSLVVGDKVRIVGGGQFVAITEIA